MLCLLFTCENSVDIIISNIKHQLNIFNPNKMKQKYFNIKTQTPKQRAERIKRNRIIRKQKLYGLSLSLQEPQAKETLPNNREDKNHIQKLKNRQAAQKSREQKKIYVTKLEQEIQSLKLKLSLLSHCSKCQKQLHISPHQLQLCPSPSESIPTNEIESFEAEQSQFMRIRSTEENSSIGIYLFVFMIILGIFCIGTRIDVFQNSQPFRRDLTQMVSYTQKKAPFQTSDSLEMSLRSTFQVFNEENLSSQDDHKGLLSMDQVKSAALMSDQKYFQRIVSSFENYKLTYMKEKHLRSKGGLINLNKSLMFCSRPKLYMSNSKNNGIFETFIDIFVKGAEIVNILHQSQQSIISNEGLSIKGLYKITASVQQIEEIMNPNLIY